MNLNSIRERCIKRIFSYSAFKDFYVFSLIGVVVVSLSFLCMFNLLQTTRRAVSTMASSIINESTPFTVSYVTVPNDEVANKLAEGLVKEKLAACVNIVPGIRSIYEWEGKIEKDSELLMVIKSRASRLEELTKYVRENHPYQVCEVISTSIIHGNPPYLKWLGEVVPEK